MANLWAVITVLLKYGPEIYEAIRSGVDEIQLTIKLRSFDAAAEKAQATGDQRDLENQFDPGRHPKP